MKLHAKSCHGTRIRLKNGTGTSREQRCESGDSSGLGASPLFQQLAVSRSYFRRRRPISAREPISSSVEDSGTPEMGES